MQIKVVEGDSSLKSTMKIQNPINLHPNVKGRNSALEVFNSGNSAAKSRLKMKGNIGTIIKKVVNDKPNDSKVDLAIECDID